MHDLSSHHGPATDPVLKERRTRKHIMLMVLATELVSYSPFSSPELGQMNEGAGVLTASWL
jgi:hypothetical protein